ncbi:MAG TPA: anti-sigma factor [Candidatus Dormibacteraeota bacterium]|nr:anti-sigma factor [Candidatus Dormibacteraeota bacterium]
MKTRDDIRDDLPLYALGSLEPEERAAVEAALVADPTLAAELREWTELVGLMALDAPDATAGGTAAPSHLRGRLLAPAHATTAPAATVARRRISWQVPLAAAAALLLAILGYREIGFRAERARTGETLAALQRALNAREGELATANVTLAKQERDVAGLRAALAAAQESVAIVQQRGLTLVSLKETKDSPPAEGHILLSSPSGRALFYAFGLPKVPDDKVYELWWITEKQGPVRAAVFQPDAQGVGRVEATMPEGVGALRAAAVTVEVAGGVPKPQGQMVLLGNAASTS